MSPRRGALALTIAVTAIVGCFSVTTARAASPSSASGRICVALVVDGRSLGSDVSTSCAKVDKGATGVDVLEAAGHRLTFRNDGLLCTIDGLPNNGCAGVDDSHYWAYFHRAPGRTNWVYSSEGPSTYQPVNDSTDGWVYDDGSARTPDNVPYSKICKPEPKPAPTATPSATHHSHHPVPSPTPTHHSTVAGASASPSTAAAHHRHRGSPSPSATPAHQNPGSHLTATRLPSAPARPPAATPAALVGGSPPPSNHHGGLALILGVAVVAALGGLAFYRFRRSA